MRPPRSRVLPALASSISAPRTSAVTPIADDERAWLRAAPPEPAPRQRERDEADALRATLSDEFDVESLLETDAALSFRRPDIEAFAERLGAPKPVIANDTMPGFKPG